MYKAQIRIILSLSSILFALSLFGNARAELRDSQTFRPIEWEESTTSSKSMYFSWLNPLMTVPLAQPANDIQFNELKNIFGIQVSHFLNNQWKGRLGFFTSRSGPKTGDTLWSFAGSDLQHSLIPQSWRKAEVFSLIEPFGYFGLGFASRWEISPVRYNLIPTFRYNESEPAAYLGVSWMIRGLGDLLLDVDLRYFQSARVSQHRFLSLGGSLVLGRWSRN